MEDGETFLAFDDRGYFEIGGLTLYSEAYAPEDLFECTHDNGGINSTDVAATPLGKVSYVIKDTVIVTYNDRYDKPDVEFQSSENVTVPIAIRLGYATEDSDEERNLKIIRIRGTQGNDIYASFQKVGSLLLTQRQG